MVSVSYLMAEADQGICDWSDQCTVHIHLALRQRGSNYYRYNSM